MGFKRRNINGTKKNNKKIKQRINKKKRTWNKKTNNPFKRIL